MPHPRQKPPKLEDQFVVVIRAATGDDALSFEDGAALIRNGSGDLLQRFDAHARRYWAWHPGLDVEKRGREVLKQVLSSPEHAELLLFYQACDDNGHIREKALRALRGHEGRLACAAALLRAEDWVQQVRDLARKMLADFAGTSRAAHFFEFLDLILLVRQRSRFADSWPTIEQALLAPQWRKQRRKAVTHFQGRVRRFALELTLTADGGTDVESLVSGVGDHSPVVSRWALAKAKESLSADALQAVLDAGFRNRMAFIRADSLRHYVGAQLPDARERARHATLDRSQTVRRVAEYLLRQHWNESVLPLWRDAFDAGRMRDEMTAALAEFCAAEDLPRLRSQITARRPRTRASALRGLQRLGAPELTTLLDAALRDVSALVVGAVTNIYAKSNEFPEAAALNSALVDAKSARLRARLLTAGRLLPKWEHLRFLLRHYLALFEEQGALLDRELERWLMNANRRFASPSNEQRTDISAALARLRQEKPRKILESISHFC